MEVIHCDPKFGLVTGLTERGFYDGTFFILLYRIRYIM